MSSIHIPPIPLIKLVTPEGYATPEMALWHQQLLQSRSAWTTFTPTVAHLTALTRNECAYVQHGKMTAIRIGLDGTGDGSTTTVTLPFTAKAVRQTFAGFDGSTAFALGIFLNTDLVTLSVFKYDGTPFPNATAHQVAISGVYEAQ